MVVTKPTIKLAELMRKHKYNDVQLAEKLHCATSTVFQWRIGQYLPRVDYLRSLCELLECSADDLLGIRVKYPDRLNRDEAVALYLAVTGDGRYSSTSLHQMATIVNRQRGEVTEFECWLREMAEVIYNIEIANRVKSFPLVKGANIKARRELPLIVVPEIRTYPINANIPPRIKKEPRRVHRKKRMQPIYPLHCRRPWEINRKKQMKITGSILKPV